MCFPPDQPDGAVPLLTALWGPEPLPLAELLHTFLEMESQVKDRAELRGEPHIAVPRRFN